MGIKPDATLQVIVVQVGWDFSYIVNAIGVVSQGELSSLLFSVANVVPHSSSSL